MKTEDQISNLDSAINQVICGDCLEIMKKLPDNSVDLVLTDPPYGMNFQSGRRREKHKKIKNDNNLIWIDEFFSQIKRVKKEDSHAYIFCSIHHIDKFVFKAKKFLDYKNIIVWEKNNTGMGDLDGDFAPKYEFIIFCSNGEKKLNGRREPNIVKFNKTNNQLHPSQKPIQLLQYLIIKSSETNDLVIDPFLGSGTTARACKDLGRRFIGIEISKKYCEIAEERLKQQNLF